MADLGKLSLDELKAQFLALGDQLSVIAEERLAILTAMQSRDKTTDVLSRVSDLNDADKQTLVNALAAQGITAA